MQLVRNLIASLVLSGIAAAQVPATTNISPTLSSIDQAAQITNVDLAKLRIEKWKADSGVKQGTQHDVDSLQRSLSSALPEMTTQARAASGDVVTLFRLYRTIGAVYDVLTSVAENAGAFGGKGEYEMLAQDVARFNTARRSLGDAVENAATQQAAQMAALRTAVTQAQAAPAEPPKKIIVDDNAPAQAKKTVHKKKSPAKPATTPPATQTGTPASGQTAPKQ